MADIKIQKAPGTWVVRVGGAVVGESANALVLSEGTLPDAIYFPRADIGMELLEASATKTTCPHKGEASYFTFSSPEATMTDLAWSYETPIDQVKEISGYLSFYGNKATVEQL